MEMPILQALVGTILLDKRRRPSLPVNVQWFRDLLPESSSGICKENHQEM